jgi:hypothetical protein
MTTIFILLVLIPLVLCFINAALNRREVRDEHVTPFTAGKIANVLFLSVYAGLGFFVLNLDALQFTAGFAFLIIYINCMVFLNWFVFTLTDVSMHIQLIMQLHRNKKLKVSEITDHYNKDKILRNRIQRLITLEQLKLENGRLYTLGKSVRFGATVCYILRIILGIPAHPEDAEHRTVALEGGKTS